MENNKEIKVAVPENYDGKPIVLIIREGDAETINNPIAWGNKAVSIKSIVEFVRKREFTKSPEENKGVVTYCLHPERARIEFDQDPFNNQAPSMSAKLTINPDLQAFGINKDRFFSSKDLEGFVLKYAHCFADIEEVKSLRGHLKNFIVKYEQTVEKANDNQGNTKDLVESSIKINKGMLPLVWKLKLPLFVAGPKIDLEVEIEIQKIVGSNMPGFGFYSMELEPKLRQAVEDSIYDQINELTKLYPCLEVD